MEGLNRALDSKLWSLIHALHMSRANGSGLGKEGCLTPVFGSRATPDAGGLSAIHARLIQNHTLQFDFTAAAHPHPLKEPAWLKALGYWIAGAVKLVAPYAVYLFWLAVAAAVGAALFLIGREIVRTRFDRNRRAPARVAPVDWRPEIWKARALLEDADRLAARGRYNEAVRLLLTRSIDDIEERRPRLVSKALTARDIASLDALPDGARRAFVQIAADVERSLFGGQALDAETFARRRADYETFAFPQAWA